MATIVIHVLLTTSYIMYNFKEQYNSICTVYLPVFVLFRCYWYLSTIQHCSALFSKVVLGKPVA